MDMGFQVVIALVAVTAAIGALLLYKQREL